MKKFKIAFVDDEEMIHTLIKIKLSSVSFFEKIELYNFSSGLDCVTHLTQVQQKEFDIIFTDITMPEMDGIELAKIINEKYPTTELYFTSALNPKVLEEKEDLNSLSKGYLEKPINLHSLTSIIEQKIL